MEIIKKYKVLFILVLVALIGFFFIFRLHYHDVKTLEQFSAAYKNFDKAIADFSESVLASKFEGTLATDDLERKVDEACIELDTKASAKLSSLIKNDSELMSTTLKIADFSREELDALKAYKRAPADHNVNLDSLVKEFSDLKNKREAAYAHFKELAGLED